jgi:hypothetical protein
MSKYDVTIDTTVGAAVPDAMSEFESLAGEMRDWYDNMPENLQGGSKGEEVSSVADSLESIDANLDVPEAVKDLHFTYVENQKKRSRSARRDYAVNLLRTAMDEVEVWADEKKVAGEEEDDEVTSFLSATQEVLEIVDGLDFPGMM